METLLFRDLSKEEIDEFLEESGSDSKLFYEGQYIFEELERPDYLYILLSGQVQVEKLDPSGKRMIVNKFNKKGTIFGEVYLYLNKYEYDYSCLATVDSQVLRIPRQALLIGDKPSPINRKINENMLAILSEKAYFLNQKILILASRNLREKIIKFLIQRMDENHKVNLTITREEMADFIGVTRPSLSRELMKMQNLGLLTIDKNIIYLNSEEAYKYL